MTVSGHPSFVVGEAGALVHNCVDINEQSEYNDLEYQHFRITEEALRDAGVPIDAHLTFSQAHTTYDRIWAGADIGVTNHPTEVLVFGETVKQKAGRGDPDESMLKLLTRIHLERISIPEQRNVFAAVADFYRPQAIAIDKTGVGLPLFQEVIEGQHRALASCFKGYNFSEKIVVGFEDQGEKDEWGYTIEEPVEILANVLEYASDTLRMLVDRGQLLLPWDIDLIREFQGQTYVLKRSTQNPYGRKVFSEGQFHALDAARMAALAWKQRHIEQTMKSALENRFEPVLDSFVSFG